MNEETRVWQEVLQRWMVTVPDLTPIHRYNDRKDELVLQGIAEEYAYSVLGDPPPPGVRMYFE